MAVGDWYISVLAIGWWTLILIIQSCCKLFPLWSDVVGFYLNSIVPVGVVRANKSYFGGLF